MMRATLAMCLFFLPGMAWGGPNDPCIPTTDARDMVERTGGRWIIVTDLQHAFLAGIYAMDPATPQGLPPGDKAALGRKTGDDTGVVFFLDGDLACSVIPVPKELLDMVDQIGSGDFPHIPSE
jgi:hypothetical protein